MKIYNELETLGFFEWLSETHNLRDTDMTPENLDKLQLNDIHRTVCDSMAFRWFREKCEFNHSIIFHKHPFGTDDYQYLILLDEDEFVETGFNTYEEAELACLKKLIEIVKNKIG